MGGTATGGPSGWMRTALAGMTAAGLIAGAGTAWLAARSLVDADEADRAAFHASVQELDVGTRVAALRQSSLGAYGRWRMATAYREQLLKKAAAAPSAEAARLRIDAAAEGAIARAAWRGIAQAARTGRPGVVDLATADRVARLELAGNGMVTSDPQEEISSADRKRRVAERLALLAAVLVASAAAFTVAQGMRTRAYAPLSVGGLVFFFGALAAAPVAYWA